MAWYNGKKKKKKLVFFFFFFFFFYLFFFIFFLRWLDDLRFYVLFYSISVISGRWADDNERLCAMEPGLRLRIFRLEQGSNSGPLDP